MKHRKDPMTLELTIGDINNLLWIIRNSDDPESKDLTIKIATQLTNSEGDTK